MMLHKLLAIFFCGFLLTIYNSCQRKENNENKKNKMINNTYKINENNKLIDGINVDSAIFKKEDAYLKKYKYKGVYLEDIYINDLLNKAYRDDFFTYLKKRENEDDFKITFFVELLMIRIQQLKDSNSFYLLSESSKDVELSYDGIELLYGYLVELFLDDPIFFIQQSTKYNDKEIINYILLERDEYLLRKKFFEENMGYVVGNGNKILLNREFEKGIDNKKLRLKLNQFPKVDVIFSPSLYTGWENQTIKFTNIYEMFFGDEITKKLSVGELVYYKLNVLPPLKNYIISAERVQQIGTIQDPDGYTNLRKEKNAHSEILQRINTGDQIEVLDNTGDWFFVRTQEGKTGYVHKSRVKN